MNRLQKIAEIVKRCVASEKLASVAIDVLMDEITPEIELMLKEQAKMVRDACVGQLFEVEYAPEEKWINALEQVDHDWVKLED